MLCIFTADTMGLGRVDASTLCDQQMLELFFVSETANVLWDQRDEDDACTWRAIQCGDTDECAVLYGRVTKGCLSSDQ